MFEVPFLPVRDDFHPKRNQARQKLATLPTSRFEDLSSDVYFELARRYPEFQEDPTDGGLTSPSSAYDDVPSPDFPSPPPPYLIPRRSPDDRAQDSGYGGSASGRRPSEDTYKRRPGEDDYPPGRRSEDSYGGVGRSSEDGYAGSAASSRRKPSQDIPSGRRSTDRERDLARRPGTTVSTNSDSTGTAGQSATATSAMIIPNKSTIAEEEIEVPFGGREGRESSSTAIDDRDRGGDRVDTDVEADRDPESDYRSPKSPIGGLSGLSARLGRDTDDDDPSSTRGGGDDYYDKMSVASDRSGGGPSSRPNPSNSANNSNTSRSGSAAGGVLSAEEQEKMRRDYEFRIATMQSKIQGLEREVGGQRERERKWEDGEERVRSMEEELNGLRRVRQPLQIIFVSVAQFFVASGRADLYHENHAERTR